MEYIEDLTIEEAIKIKFKKAIVSKCFMNGLLPNVDKMNSQEFAKEAYNLGATVAAEMIRQIAIDNPHYDFGKGNMVENIICLHVIMVSEELE